MSSDPQVDRKRRHGSHVETLEQLLKKREALVKEAAQTTAAINTHYRACVEDERVDRTLPGTIAPGRRGDVTVDLRALLLDERPPRDLSGLQRLTEITRREQAERERWQAEQREKVARSGLTKLASESPMQIGNL